MNSLCNFIYVERKGIKCFVNSKINDWFSWITCGLFHTLIFYGAIIYCIKNSPILSFNNIIDFQILNNAFYKRGRYIRQPLTRILECKLQNYSRTKAKESIILFLSGNSPYYKKKISGILWLHRLTLYIESNLINITIKYKSF